MTKNVLPVMWKDKKLPAGTELPDEAVEFFTQNSPEILDDIILVGSKWINIKKLSKEFIEMNKTKIKKLGDYFGIEKEKPKADDTSHMARVHPKKVEPSEVLDLKDKNLTELREIAKTFKIPKYYKLKENKLIKEILKYGKSNT